MKVREIMSGNPVHCGPETDLADAAMRMWRADCGIVPVVDPTTLKAIGVITDRDICMAVATRHLRAEQIRVREVMSGRLIAVHGEDDVRAAMDAMKTERVRRLPVLDRDDHLEGIVSVNDLVLSAQVPSGRMHPPIVPHDIVEVLKAVGAHTRTNLETVVPGEAEALTAR